MNYVFANMAMSSNSVPGDAVSSSIGTPSHTVSWFGRANYNFMDRYLFTVTMRADGSSKFRGDNKWGYFPAAAAAWRISDEPFLAGSREWLDNLKLRVSYGTSGNDGIDAGLFDTLWKTGTATINGETVTTYVPADCLGNPDLKWETTISRNIGLDFGFWNGKLRGTLDFYWNTTKDVLMRVPCDATTGFSYQYQNVGQTSNKGIELTLNYEIYRSKDFNLSFGATINHNKNNVDELMEGVTASAHTNWGSTMRVPYYDYLVKVDEPVGLIQGLKSAGIYTVDDFNVVDGVWTLKPGIPDYTATSYAGSDAYKLAEGQKAFPGMAKFEDIDGDGKVTTSDVDVIGHTQADLTGGFNFNGRYKDLDFAANFTYQIGGEVYNANVMHAMMGNKDTGLGQGRLAEVADCWRMYDVDASGELYAVTDPTALAALNANAKYALPYSEYGIASSQFIENASYLRLQTLTVGYTLPKELTKKIGVNRLRVYATGGNLFCLKGYSGLDPDVNVSPSADSSYSGFPTPNYDFRSYPKSRTFTFGLNVTF
jgi:TonB-linked SusC/RagA family outer membrane protein